MNIKELWNSQADHQNQWDSLGEDEKLEFVAAHEREECAKLCDGLADMHEKMNQWGQFKTAETLAQAIRARSKT